jgi:hypothetical protein
MRSVYAKLHDAARKLTRLPNRYGLAAIIRNECRAAAQPSLRLTHLRLGNWIGALNLVVCDAKTIELLVVLQANALRLEPS